MTSFRALLIISLSIILSSCGGGGGGGGGGSDNSRTSSELDLTIPLRVDPSRLYTGNRSQATLNKAFIQEILSDYIVNTQILSEITGAANGFSNFIGDPSARETIVCDQGGSQTGTLYQRQNSTFIRITSNACSESNVLYSGSVEYEFSEASQNSYQTKIVLDAYKAGNLSIDGEIRISEVNANTAIVVNIVFSAVGKQFYLENVNLPKASVSGYSSEVLSAIGHFYYSDKGRIDIQSGYHLELDGLSEFRPVNIDPIRIMGANESVADIKLNSDWSENLDSTIVSIKYVTGAGQAARYLRSQYEQFFATDFSKNENYTPVALPLSIPAFDTYPHDDVIKIDARGSTDQDNDYLSYEWELIKSPTYSRNSRLENSNEPLVKLYPGGWGTYIIGLKAFDGQNWSEQKQFELNFGEETDFWSSSFVISNGDDFYRDGAYQGLPVTTEVIIQARDFDIDISTYRWVFTRVPAGSQIGSLTGDERVFQFTPDVRGRYGVSVTVTDSLGIDKTFNSSITVSDDEYIKPKITISGEHFITLGTDTRLNIVGRGGKPVNAYRWRVVEAPEGSSLGQLSGVTSDIIFSPDVAGRYELHVSVANEDLTSNNEKVIVHVRSKALFRDTETISFSADDRNSYAAKTFIGDLDGNGELDIIDEESVQYNDVPGEYLRIYLQDSSKQFENKLIFFRAFSENTKLIDVLDFTGDGAAELIVRRGSEFQIFKLSSNGTLVLLGHIALPTFNGYSLNHHPVFGDIDGDGKKDIVWRASSSLDIFDESIYFALQSNNPSNILSYPLEYPLPNSRTAYQVENWSALRILEKAEGEKSRIAILSYLGSDGQGENAKLTQLQFGYSEQTGVLILEKEAVLDSVDLGPYLYRTYVDDINHDGLVDIVSYSQDQGLKIYFSVEAQGSHSVQLLDKFTIPIHSIPEEVQLIDLNNDGMKDVVFGSYIFTQAQSQAFDQATQIQLGSRTIASTSMYIDFNHDGLVDAIDVTGDSLSVKYFDNN